MSNIPSSFYSSSPLQLYLRVESRLIFYIQSFRSLFCQYKLAYNTPCSSTQTNFELIWKESNALTANVPIRIVSEADLMSINSCTPHYKTVTYKVDNTTIIVLTN